jgi:HSP20 family molecular chaperone IbpA
MEIDYRSFEREIYPPAEVDPTGAKAEQSDGLLWIRLPFQTQA